MCLVYKKENSDKFVKSHTGKIKCYKVVAFTCGRLMSYYQYHIYKPGISVSNRNTKEITILNDDTVAYDREYWLVYKGIHVFYNRADAEHELKLMACGTFGSYVIIEVECDMEDFVGADSKEAVFMQVYLSQEEYDRAMKEVA